MTTRKSSRSPRPDRPAATAQERNAGTSVPSRPAKIQGWHLDRLAVVYVRQSTPQQVSENTESTQRQYALKPTASSSSTRTRATVAPAPRAGSASSGSGTDPGRNSRFAEVTLNALRADCSSGDMDLTVPQFMRTMKFMNTIETLIPHEVMAELQEAADQAAKGLRDPDAARKACERMDRMREKNRQRFGTQDVGVEIIREMRDTR